MSAAGRKIKVLTIYYCYQCENMKNTVRKSAKCSLCKEPMEVTGVMETRVDTQNST